MSIQNARLPVVSRFLVIVVLLGAGFLAGVSSRDATVQADVRRNQSDPQHFQSGAQRSEALLREISATLGKMDQRLARLENLGTRLVNATRSSEESR